jgi:hypothetical protein
VQWANLPLNFRLSTSLKECSGDAFERDMLASMRLDQLHVLFLLQLSFLDTLTEPDPSILDVSDQMLALVVETVLLRDQLVMSSTSQVWKVCSPNVGFRSIIPRLNSARFHTTVSRPRGSFFFQC